MRSLPLALLLILSVVGSAGSGRLWAQDPLVDTTPQSVRSGQPAAEPLWTDETWDPSLRRLPPPDGLTILEDPQPLDNPKGGRGGSGFSGEGERSPFTARLWWIPSQDLQNQPGELAVNGQEIELAFPVRIDTAGIWLALGSFQRLELSTAAVLPDSGLPVPDQLWDLEVGTMHIRELANGWRAGGMLRVGSPSDRPFEALRDMTVTLLGFVTIPAGERDAWSLSLFYSPTGQIIFPLPGVAYIWRPSPQFQAHLGIPFSLEYRPTESLTLTAGYRPLNNVEVLVRQSLGERWSIYGSYGTVNETFLLADRLDDQQRTYVFHQRLTLGVQRQLGRGWSVDFSAAYVFDRQIFQAEKFSGSRRDELRIDPGVAGTIQLLWTR